MTRRRIHNTAAAFVATLTIGVAAQSVAPTDAHALRKAPAQLTIDQAHMDTHLTELGPAKPPPPPPPPKC
jgi:hypothetical protein